MIAVRIKIQFGSILHRYVLYTESGTGAGLKKITSFRTEISKLNGSPYGIDDINCDRKKSIRIGPGG